jgi:hypothetical protein
LNPNTAPPASPNNDEFGDSIALTRNYLVVGSHGFDRASAQTLGESGAAYIFELNSPNVAATLLSPTAAAKDFFGEGVAASGNLAVAGIPGADIQATDQGAAMVFALDTPEQKRGELIRFDTTTGFWWGMDFRINGTATPQEKRLDFWATNAELLALGELWKTGRTGDFDGDGHFDLAAEVTTGQWWVKLSSNSAAAPLGYWARGMTNIQIADVTGDGLDDIVGFLPSQSSWWGLISNGSFFTLTYLTAWAPSTTFADPFIADFMNDGTADVMGRDSNTGLWWIDNRVRDSVTKVVSSVRFVWGQWARTIGGNTITWQDVQIADYTTDGRLDIAGRLEVAPAPNGEWWVSARPGNSLAAHQMVGVWAKSKAYNNVHFDGIRSNTRADIFGQTNTGVWTSGGQVPFADVFTITAGLVRRSYVSDVVDNLLQEVLMISSDNRVRVVKANTASWTILNTYIWTFGTWLFEGTEDRLW